MSQHQKVTAQQTFAGRPCAGTRTEKWARLPEAPAGLWLQQPQGWGCSGSWAAHTSPCACRHCTCAPSRTTPRCPRPSAGTSQLACALAPTLQPLRPRHHLCQSRHSRITSPVRTPHSGARLRAKTCVLRACCTCGPSGGTPYAPVPPPPTLVPPHLRSFCCSGPQASLGLPKQNPHPHRLLLILGTPRGGRWPQLQPADRVRSPSVLQEVGLGAIPAH